MKRLSLLFVGLLSAVLIFSAVGLADEADKVTSTLTFESVLDIGVNDTLSSAEISQNTGEGSVFLEGYSGENVSFGTFTSTVVSIVPYQVGATFYASYTGGTYTNEPVEETSTNLIELTGTLTYTLPWFDSAGVTFAYADLQDGANVGPASGELVEITDEFSASPDNNLSTGGDTTGALGVELDPAQLVFDDYNDDGTLTVDVVLWAYTATDYP